MKSKKFSNLFVSLVIVLSLLMVIPAAAQTKSPSKGPTLQNPKPKVVNVKMLAPAKQESKKNGDIVKASAEDKTKVLDGSREKKQTKLSMKAIKSAMKLGKKTSGAIRKGGGGGAKALEPKTEESMPAVSVSKKIDKVLK